jgi:hypothetical protein
MRLFTRSYRNTAATTAATTPARLNGALVVHNRHPLPGRNTPRLGRSQAAMEATTTSQLRTCVPTSQARCCPSKAEGKPIAPFRVYLNTQFPTALISIFIQLEADVGRTRRLR